MTELGYRNRFKEGKMDMKAGARFSVVILFASAAVPTFAAQMPPTTNDLSAQANALGRCFVNKSTGDDRMAVARWMLAGMASAPRMADVAKVDPSRKVEADKGMAAVFTRLMTIDCANEARPLFLAKSKAAFETAGGALGEIAMKELLSDPKAAEGLSGYIQYLDERAFAKVTK